MTAEIVVPGCEEKIDVNPGEWHQDFLRDGAYLNAVRIWAWNVGKGFDIVHLDENGEFSRQETDQHVPPGCSIVLYEGRVAVAT
jgi:hypothetical protein